MQTLREDIRAWLKENSPTDWRELILNASHETFVELQKDWFQKLFAAGFAIPHWSEGWHGGGRTLEEQKIIFEEIANADAPRLILYFMSLYHAASTLLEFGSEQQKDEYLQKIIDGEVWCQGFSEPNAGSDLASLRTKAERQGDVYVINGQKTWSTVAQYADRCLLLARTSRDGAPQAGLTYFLLDMRTKGVTVRPIKQISGDEEFSEIFFDNVEIPIADRIGEEGQGWQVAQATLASERGLTLVELSLRMKRSLSFIAAEIHSNGRAPDPTFQLNLSRLSAKVQATCALASEYLNKRITGTEQVGDASIVKLYYANTLREFTKLGGQVAGLHSQLNHGFMRGAPQETGQWMLDLINSYNWSIAGGSNEIQRNIIAERLLQMPREPKSWMTEARV